MGTFELFIHGRGLAPNGYGAWAYFVRPSRSDEVHWSSEGMTHTTSSRAALTAAIRGLETTSPGSVVRIITSSHYLFTGVEGRLQEWRSRGWQTQRHTPLMNPGLWKRLAELLDERQVSCAWSDPESSESKLVVKLASRAARRRVYQGPRPIRRPSR